MKLKPRKLFDKNKTKKRRKDKDFTKRGKEDIRTYFVTPGPTLSQQETGGKPGKSNTNHIRQGRLEKEARRTKMSQRPRNQGGRKEARED